MTAYALVLCLGLVAGCISGVLGTGSSLLLLPVLSWNFGPKAAVPIMAVASLCANAARVAVWWRQVDWRSMLAYSLPGIPAAALGAHTLLQLPATAIELGLGLFLLAMVPWRHRRRTVAPAVLGLPALAAYGAIIGFLTGLLLSTGPLSVPVFLARGLQGGAFIGTEAASALTLYVAKAATFRELGALPGPLFLHGIVVGTSLMLGTLASRRLMLRLPPRAFGHLQDAMLLFSGSAFLWQAWH